MCRLRIFLWRLLGIDYHQILRVQDNVFLKKDKFSELGEGTYDNGALVFRWTQAPLRIGKYCSIANNVRFIVDEGYHTASGITSFPIVNTLFKEEKTLPDGVDKNEFLSAVNQREGITIGHDVWIGMGVHIMPGVTLGNGITIAANSVVTGSTEIPDYSIIAGTPAKVIAMKHDKDVINKLNDIAWWDWDKKTIKSRVKDFYSSGQTKEESIEQFIKKYGK